MGTGRGRAPCCDKTKVRTGPWSPAEDLRLMNFIQRHGHNNWRALPKQAGLLRCGKSCRLRWINYLRPDVKRGNFTPEEENTIIQLHNSIGNKWSKIASCLPGRTDNEIKNVWNTHLKKRLNKTAASTDQNYCRSRSTPPPDENNMEIINKSLQNSPSSSSSSSSNLSNSNSNLNQDPKLSSNPQMEKHEADDFWELLDSLDSLQPNITPAGKVQVEVGSWLRFLENELGLPNDNIDHHLPQNSKYQDTIQPDHQFLDFSAPTSPVHHYLGI